MKDYAQGDIISVSSYQNRFVIISKNAFIRAAGVFHVCPLIAEGAPGPLHISVKGVVHHTAGTVICEQIKLIDPEKRSCRRLDRLSYSDVMEVSDALQGIFEYD